MPYFFCKKGQSAPANQPYQNAHANYIRRTFKRLVVWLAVCGLLNANFAHWLLNATGLREA